MSLRFGTIQSCLNLMVVLSCQRDRARKRDASRAWACLPHTFTPGPTTTARTPRRLHCSSSRVYPADVRELARPARQPSRGRAVVPVVPYELRRTSWRCRIRDFRTRASCGPYAVYRACGWTTTIGDAMLKDKNSSRSEAQPQGARRRASGGAEPPDANGTPRDGENAPHASFGWDPLHI